MFKLQFSFFIALIFLIGCKDKQTVPGKKDTQHHFNYFEISYTGGWGGHLSFIADSNKIFFSPSPNPSNLLYKVKYGILPDSLYDLIDSTISILKTDTTGRSTVITCDDCAVVSIKAISDKDTIHFFQSGEINPAAQNLLDHLRFFADSSKHDEIKALMLPETASEVWPPPPPIKNK